MTKKTAPRGGKSRVASKSKRKTAKTKAKKAVGREVTRRTKSAAKAKRPGAKPKANPRKATSSVVAWPGLPPGYFQRAR